MCAEIVNVMLAASFCRPAIKNDLGGRCHGPDGNPVTITITGITQDEPTHGLGTGGAGPDGFGVGASQAQLRAERSGSGNGPTTNTHAIAPTINTPVVIAMAATKLPQDKNGKDVRSYLSYVRCESHAVAA